MAHETLQETLGHTGETNQFVELALRMAGAHGIALDADAVRSEIKPDPLGLARWAVTPTSGSYWPPRHWLPIQVSAYERQLFVDWAHFGAGPLTQPFFEDSIRRAMMRPFNRMFRYRTPIGDFLDAASRVQSLQPSGFIFHMSRCGSTLVSQMLAALPSNVVISEAAPIDAIVRINAAWSDLPAEQHVSQLIAMIAAYGRRRSGSERHYFIKLDSWHALALPLFRRAFASVPWVVLSRDPIEVMVSQTRQRGAQMVPGIISPSLYGIDVTDGMPPDEYCARVLNKICTAAVEQGSKAGGLLVNYRELPEAFWTKILLHFGVTYSESEREAMRRAARYDAKAPGFEFANDSETKQREATLSVRAIAERRLGEVYQNLEALRLRQPF